MAKTNSDARCRLVSEAKVLDRPGVAGQVLPVSRPICSVGSEKNLVSVSHSSVLPEWDSLVVFPGNRVSP